MPCFHVLALASVVLVLVDYSQRARAVTTCDFDLWVNKTGCTGPLMSSLPELGAQEGSSYFSEGTEHLASPYCLKTSGGGGFFGAGSVKLRQSDNDCTVYLEYAPTYESLDCAQAANLGDSLFLDIGDDPCSPWPLLGPAPGKGLPETAPWLLACICFPDTVGSLIVWDAESPSTSSPSSEAFPASAASSSSNALANAGTSSSTPTPTSDNNLQEIANDLQGKSIRIQLGLGLGLGLPTLILALLGVRWLNR